MATHIMTIGNARFRSALLVVSVLLISMFVSGSLSAQVAQPVQQGGGVVTNPVAQPVVPRVAQPTGGPVAQPVVPRVAQPTGGAVAQPVVPRVAQPTGQPVTTSVARPKGNPNGGVCEVNADCRSGYCADGTFCAPRDGTGRAGEYCHHGNHCRSGTCSCGERSGRRGILEAGFCPQWDRNLQARGRCTR